VDDSFQLVGTAIEDRYRVDAVIGEGGFGVVYRGYHLRLEHPIAIKCLKIPGHFTSEARELFLSRFREEGRILIKLADASGVPRIYDYGIAEARGQKVPFLVLEWLDGQTLEDSMRARRSSGLGGLSPTEALFLFLPAVDAIAVAHEHHIAHRDIKPPNMFLVRGSKGPTMKVLDFGIAKAMQEGEALAQAKTQTATSFRAFTPNYAAPEQFAPKRYGASGPWTDVHALGLLLFEMLTAVQANKGEDLVECLEFATSESRPSAKAAGAAISDALEAVLARAIARNPEQRFSDAGAFAAALRALPEASALPTQPLAVTRLESQPATERGEPLPAQLSQVSGRTTPLVAPTPSAVAPPNPAAATLIAGAQPAPAGMLSQQAERTELPFGGVGAPGANAVTNLEAPVLARPVQPVKPRSSGGKGVAIGAGLLVMVGIGAVAFLSLRPSQSSRHQSLDAEVSGVVSADYSLNSEVSYAFEVLPGRDLYVPVPISETEVKGKTHYRLTRIEDQIVQVDKVGPAGNVLESSAIKRQADGGWTRTKTNGRQVIIETVKQTAAGIETHENRYGYPFEQGCARWQLTFTKAGDIEKRICQDQGGHVIIDSSGCQVLAFTSNEQHQLVDAKCQQEDGTPVMDASGVYTRKFAFDDKGRLSEIAYYSIGGSAVTNVNGCARNRFTYDNASNILEQQCIGPTGMITTFANSAVAATRRSYDANGCVLEEMNVDSSGRPIQYGDAAGRRFGRNQYCEEISSAVVDVQGRLAGAADSVVSIEQEFDGEGNAITQRCFNKQKKPFNCAGLAASKEDGSLLRFTFDDKGRNLVEKAFNAAGQPTIAQLNYQHEARKTYNEYGQVVEVRHFDVEGKPAPVLGNVAVRRIRYDALGSEVSNASFGVNDEPVADRTLVHEIRRSYDELHRLSTVELRDERGELVKKNSLLLGRMTWPTRAAQLVVERQGSQVWNRFLDATGKEISALDCSKPTTICEQ
jgi:serine/threonine protein kinase